MNAHPPVNDAGDLDMEMLTPFDLKFREVTGISQKVSNDLAQQRLAPKSVALRFEPRGIAPYYSFMMLIDCLYGEKVQRTVTYNLGRFIKHVLEKDNPHLVAHLVDENKLTTDRLSEAGRVLQSATAIAGYYANSPNSTSADAGAGEQSHVANIVDSLQNVLTNIEMDRERSLQDQLDQLESGTDADAPNTQ
jgi:hypothetical protein